jgi:hypothetical protein
MSSPQPQDDAITTGEAGGSAPSAGSPTHARLAILSRDEKDAIANGASSLESEAMRANVNAAKFMRHYASVLRRLLSETDAQD